MKNDAQVYRYMSPCPQVISRDSNLAAAREMMERFKIRHLPVLDDGDLVGIVSDRDLALSERFCDPHKTALGTVMTAPPYVVAPSTPLADVAFEMAEQRIGAAIVVDGGRVAGVFTTVDALRAMGQDRGRRDPSP